MAKITPVYSADTLNEGKILNMEKGGTGAATGPDARNNLAAPSRDLAGLSQTGTTLIANMAGLSGRFINVSISTGVQYTAPADGAIYWDIKVETPSSYRITAKNVTKGFAVSQSGINITTYDDLLLPVSKGDVVTIEATTGVTQINRFYYANGAY